MRNSTATVQASTMLQTVKMQGKAKPFAAHFTTKLEAVNSKLVCALSVRGDNYCFKCTTTCSDD